MTCASLAFQNSFSESAMATIVLDSDEEDVVILSERPPPELPPGLSKCAAMVRLSVKPN